MLAVVGDRKRELEYEVKIDVLKQQTRVIDN
jgi:hypothetical protein